MLANISLCCSITSVSEKGFATYCHDTACPGDPVFRVLDTPDKSEYDGVLIFDREITPALFGWQARLRAGDLSPHVVGVSKANLPRDKTTANKGQLCNAAKPSISTHSPLDTLEQRG
jgi:hypothetical protein